MKCSTKHRPDCRPGACKNCGRSVSQLRGGRCCACVSYRTRHGVERPPNGIRRTADKARPVCSNCKLDLAGEDYKHLCNACYMYKRRTGRNRPRRLFRENCKVCGRPKGVGFARGRCHACYTHWRRKGRDRTPDELASIAPYGWCECKKTAVTVLDTAVGEIPLCADCLALEES